MDLNNNTPLVVLGWVCIIVSCSFLVVYRLYDIQEAKIIQQFDAKDIKMSFSKVNHGISHNKVNNKYEILYPEQYYVPKPPITLEELMYIRENYYKNDVNANILLHQLEAVINRLQNTELPENWPLFNKLVEADKIRESSAWRNFINYSSTIETPQQLIVDSLTKPQCAEIVLFGEPQFDPFVDFMLNGIESTYIPSNIHLDLTNFLVLLKIKLPFLTITLDIFSIYVFFFLFFSYIVLSIYKYIKYFIYDEYIENEEEEI